MAVLRINTTLASNGDGSFATPYNAVPGTSVDGNTYLGCEGTYVPLVTNWTLGRTDVTLGTYDANTGEQIFDPKRQAIFTTRSAGSGTRPTISASSTTRLKVHWVEITNEAPEATNRMGIYNSAAASATGLEVLGCTIHGIRGSTGTHNGIQLVASGNSGVLIAKNRVYDIGEDGLHFQGTAGLRCEDNEVFLVSMDNANGDCLQLSGAVPDYWVVGNRFDRRRGYAGKQGFIASGMTSTGGVFAGNDIYADDVGTTALYVEQDANQVIGNRIFGGSQGMEIQGDATLALSNLIVASANHVADYIGIRMTAGVGIEAYHNTIVSQRLSASASSYGIRQVSGTDSFVRNNIVVGFATGISASGSTESNNCYWRNTAVGLTPTNPQPVDPMFDVYFMPQNRRLRRAGYYLGRKDLYGVPFANPPTIGAVEWQRVRAALRAARFG